MTRGEKLREYREKLGFTQGQMADALGYARGSNYRGAQISLKEIGARTVTVPDMLAARCLWLEANWTHN